LTTVAWDGKKLAVDSRVMGSCIRSEAGVKLFHVEELWIAGSGNYEDVLLAVKWYRDGCPDIKPTLGDDFAMLIKRGERVYRVEKRLMEWEVIAPFVAAGSGVELALGAMAMGASAIEAVKIASRFDAGTNDVVQHTP
jgi:hypothetical protein